MNEIKPVKIIKTAEERIALLGRAAGWASVDKWRGAHKEEAAELRAAYETLQKENAELVANIELLNTQILCSDAIINKQAKQIAR